MHDEFFSKNPCAEFCDSRKKIVVKDKGNNQEYRLINNGGKFCCKIRVDGCLIKEGKKCDYLIVNCSDSLAIFIELKGKKLSEACEQIKCSLEILTQQNYWQDLQVIARIVLNKVSPNPPKTSKSSPINRLRVKLNDHNKQLKNRNDLELELVKYKSQVLEETV